jgi:hypothetical protein
MGLGSGIRDPGSGKNLFQIPDPGIKKAPDPGSRIRVRNTAYNHGLINFKDTKAFVCVPGRSYS